MTLADLDLADLPATRLTSAYRSGELSPVEVTEAVLTRIATWEPTLNALCAHRPDAARQAAKSAEDRWHRGEPLSEIDGVPATLKENIATEGNPVPLGTAAIEPVPAAADAPAAARLFASGAVLVGTTTMPDYGMLSSGLSSLRGITRNPWNETRNPGGSSSGAGAAAAAGYGPLHLGTDIGGSIRLPANWCGVAGFKPSFGRIPVDPPYPGRTLGPLTRTVADAALFTSVLAGPDPRDHLSLPAAQLDWRNLTRDLTGLRIGLMLDVGIGLPVEQEILDAVKAAARSFAVAGAHVETVGPMLTDHMLDGLDKFWRTRFWLEINALPPERQARMLPYIARWAAGGEGLSGAEVFDGYSQMDAMARAAVTHLAPYDFLLSPVAPVSTFGAELASPRNDPQRPFEHVGFTVPFNMSGQPAIAVRCGGTAEGLPIGLQIVGQRFDDMGVLAVAAEYEQLRPSPPAWPVR